MKHVGIRILSSPDSIRNIEHFLLPMTMRASNSHLNGSAAQIPGPTLFLSLSVFRILLYYGAGGRQNNRLADAAVLGEFGPSERVYGVAVGQTGADYKTTKEGEWGTDGSG